MSVGLAFKFLMPFKGSSHEKCRFLGKFLVCSQPAHAPTLGSGEQSKQNLGASGLLLLSLQQEAPALAMKIHICVHNGPASPHLAAGLLCQARGGFPDAIRHIQAPRAHTALPPGTQSCHPKPVFVQGYVCLELTKAICIK